MSPGTYNNTGTYEIGSDKTSAPKLFVRGNGATIAIQGSEGRFAFQDVPAVLRGVTVVAAGGFGTFSAPVVAEHIHIEGGFAGVVPGLDLTIRDFSIEVTGATGVPINFPNTADKVTLERGVVHGGRGILVSGTLNATNVLFYGMTTTALNTNDDETAHGKLEFCTIADSGPPNGTGVAGVKCNDSSTGGFQIESTIVWTPNSTLPPVASCVGTSSIVGPVKVPGIITADPMFVDEANGNYHLAPGSPAIDMVNTGPASDFEGDARPQGARFDIGADEAN